MGMEHYWSQAADYLSFLMQNQKEIQRAAALLTKITEQNRLIHIFGAQPFTSSLIATVFFRGGGLANLNPIMDPSLDIAHGAWRSSLCRDLKGLAPCVLDYYENIQPGDAMLLLSEDPSSRLFREAVEHSLAKQLPVIVVAPLSQTTVEGCLCIDLGAAPSLSDGLLAAGFSMVLDLLLQQAAEGCKAPPRWQGRGFPTTGGNEEILDAYWERIRHL
jgi:hypothetical protein